MAKLTAVGIIAEYNPFHHGHAFLLDTARKLSKADVIVVAMGGNWLQRGEPAILDKWQRTQLALANGADIVVELPTNVAMQPADRFAAGGVRLLGAMQCQTLAFGAEHPDLDFNRLSQSLPTGSAKFKQYNQSYAAQYQQALHDNAGIALEDANDILALAYARVNQMRPAPLKLLPVGRQASGHHDITIDATASIASATAIRQMALQGKVQALSHVVPETTLAMLEEQPLVNWESFWPLLQYQLITSSLDDLKRIYQMSEGLENRMKRVAMTATNFEDFMQQVKTKRYTYTRIQRLAAYVLLQVHDDEMMGQSNYQRLLGMTAKGQAYLNQIKQDLPQLVSRASQDFLTGVGALDYRVGQVRQLITQGASQDWARNPIIVA